MPPCADPSGLDPRAVSVLCHCHSALSGFDPNAVYDFATFIFILSGSCYCTTVRGPIFRWFGSALAAGFHRGFSLTANYPVTKLPGREGTDFLYHFVYQTDSIRTVVRTAKRFIVENSGTMRSLDMIRLCGHGKHRFSADRTRPDQINRRVV